MTSLIKQFIKKWQRSEWNSVKKSSHLYPAGPMVTLKIKSTDGRLLSGWVNSGYKKYAHRQFCAYNFLINVTYPGAALSHTETDMETVEQYFRSQLQNVCVSHMVARLATIEGLNLEMYLEDATAGKAALQKMANNPYNFFSFTYEYHFDPDWEAVSGIFNYIKE